jgi:cerevisin
LLVAEHPHGTVNNSYIVMLKPSVTPALLSNHMNFVSTVHASSDFAGDDAAGLRHVYDSHVKGYAGTFSESVVDAIRQMPEVDYVERDQIVRTMEIDIQGSQTTQIGAPWVRNL